MNPLIPPQEAEKAAREYAESVYPNPAGEDVVLCEYRKANFNNGINYANQRFAEDYAPVLEKCKDLLEFQNRWMQKLPIHIKEKFADKLAEIEYALTNLNNLMK